MKFRFSSFLLALLLLVSAQGAFAATNYFSNNGALANADVATPITTKWSTSSDGTCTGTLIASSGTVAVTAGDTFTICSAHTLTIATSAVTAGIKNIIVYGTITSTAAFALSLATDANLINNGTITLTNTAGAAAIILQGTGTYSGTGVLTSTCQAIATGGDWMTPATWETSAKTVCGVTTGGTNTIVPGSSSDVILPGTMTVAVTLGAPATVKSLTIADNGMFTLTSKLTISGNYTNSAATAADVVLTGGTLAFTDAAHQITIAVARAYPVIDLSSFITAHTVTFVGGFPTTIDSLVLPTSTLGISVVAPASGAVTINAITGNTLTAAGTATPTSGIPPITVAVGTGTLATGTGTGAVSAPIFSTKEKAKVFVEGVNN